MKNYVLSTGLIVTVLLLSCSSHSNRDLLRPDWTGIDTSQLEFKIGDCLSLNDSNRYVTAIILDLDSDSAGIWYGFCFTNLNDSVKPSLMEINNSMLFGRQIPSGLINTECLDCYDIAYLSESGLSRDREKFGLIGRIKYDYSKVRIGSEWPSHNFSGLMNAYISGIERRKKTPDDCKTSIYKQNAVLERYFPIRMIK